jgi:hypothetical protein
MNNFHEQERRELLDDQNCKIKVFLLKLHVISVRYLANMLF